MSTHPAPALPRQDKRNLAYNLAGIGVLVLLLAVGAAYVIDEMSRDARTPMPRLDDGDPIVQTISGTELTIPTAWFRHGEQIRNGFTDQIDLRLQFEFADHVSQRVDVTLLPRGRARTSASLLDRVYLHQFSDETLGDVPGLIGKPMTSANGYAGETVWYDAISPNPFVTKCIAALSADGAPQCVRTVYLPSGIAAVFTFDATLLPSWRQFDAEMERWLTVIGAVQS